MRPVPVLYAVVVALALVAPSPARAQPATTPLAPGVSAELLFAVGLAAEFVPADLSELFLYRYTIAPGVALAYPEGYVPPTALAEHVVAGQLVRRPTADFYLWRAGAALGPPERVAAGAEVALGPGDTAVVPRLPFDRVGKDAQGEVRSDGAEPAVAVGFTFRSAGPAGTFPPTGMRFEAFQALSGSTLERAFPAGPVAFRLEWLHFAPGATLPPAAPQGLELYGVLTGRLSWVTARPDGGTPAAGFPIFEGTGTTTAFLPAGARYGLVNEGDREAVALRLTVAPARLGEAVLAAGTPTP